MGERGALRDRDDPSPARFARRSSGGVGPSWSHHAPQAPAF